MSTRCLQSSKSEWESSTTSSSSPFQQTLLEVGAAAGESQSGSDPSRTAAVDIEEPDYAALSTEKLGRIQFSVLYDFDEQTLTVKIIKAEGLAAKDLSGTSDPYVKISLLPDKKHTLSTNIKRKNLNPRWNEVFAFEGKLADFRRVCVVLSVYQDGSLSLCNQGTACDTANFKGFVLTCASFHNYLPFHKIS